jgi:hypothetical protein
MTQTQLLLTIFIPTLTVLIGILLNKHDAGKLETRLSGDMGSLDRRLTGIEGRLDARITGLESRLHTDMLMVIGKLTELEVRVARLEGQRQ